MGKQCTWEIVIADRKKGHFQAASKLIALGVPLAVARRYQLVRRDMTVGLKRRLEKAKN